MNTTQNTSTTYNGWKNRQTWNVALWIQNDQGIYNAALAYLKHIKTNNAWRKREKQPLRTISYTAFLSFAGLEGSTPDGISWTAPGIDHKAIAFMLKEFAD